ncbi:MAG TPA: RNA polymerase factor sigma-54 [Pseudolabrys sp.]|nr:RNA polymerase factor sigma-54 [Pseudolabrys sp.]
MALSQRLEFRQAQALVMTPQLMQAIKLLQLSSPELAAYVEGEIEKNPLLERGADEEPVSIEEIQDPSNEGGEEVREAFDWMEGEIETGEEGGAKSSAANDLRSGRHAEWAGSGSPAEEYNLEAFVSAEKTLADHLAEQLCLAISNPAGRMIGQYLIDMVDEAGYLTGELDAIAEKLGARRSDVELVLAVLQTFDPPGVCARNLAECLAIQLKDRDRYDPAMKILVEHLDLVARRDFATLRRLCGVTDEDLTDMISELRMLNPKPGLNYGSTAVQAIVPDVFVRRAPDGTWQVELNSETLPRVLVNHRYYAEVSKTTRNQQAKQYMADCLQTATWLMRALDQRAKTILKVSSEIVRQQHGFFASGVQHLRPLNLRSIADAIGMHESTVSRVTANKYLSSDRGIFELKYFFTPSIAAAGGGEAHSAEAVRHHIRHLINGEDAENVLSDDTIVEKLRQLGIEIARRTVAKYRETMRIPSSVQRRRRKLAKSA